jgi:hypothetical protein
LAMGNFILESSCPAVVLELPWQWKVDLMRIYC